MNIDTIFFDAYGTLIDIGDYFRGLPVQVLKDIECDLDPHQFMKYWNEVFINTIFDVIEEKRPFLNIRTIYRTSLKDTFLKHSIPVSEAQLDELNMLCKQLLDRKCVISPSVRNVIKTLKDDGMKVGIISNGDREELLQHLGDVAELFDDMIISENLEVYKPDHRIFKFALERLKTRPENALFIGDNIKIDIAGANNANIYSVWYNKNGELPEDGIKPHFTITGINEVLDIMKLVSPMPR